MTRRTLVKNMSAEERTNYVSTFSGEWVRIVVDTPLGAPYPEVVGNMFGVVRVYLASLADVAIITGPDVAISLSKIRSITKEPS